MGDLQWCPLSQGDAGCFGDLFNSSGGKGQYSFRVCFRKHVIKNNKQKKFFTGPGKALLPSLLSLQ